MSSHRKSISISGKILIIISIIAFAGKAGAQVLPEYSAFSTSIGLQAGTQGVGAQGTYNISRSLNIRAALFFTPDITLLYRGRDLQVNRNGAYATLDWQPLYGRTDWIARKWFISGGAGYYFSNTLYRQAYNSTLPNYYSYLSKFRPYIGTGISNVRIYKNVYLRLDLGDFIPTSAPVSTYDNASKTITNGLHGIWPGLNTSATFYIKF